MATYKEIRGNNIPIRSSDPSNPIIGEMWYNTTTGILKGRKFNSDSFTSINARSTSTQGSGQSGTASAGLVTAGFTGSFPIDQDGVEHLIQIQITTLHLCLEFKQHLS